MDFTVNILSYLSITGCILCILWLIYSFRKKRPFKSSFLCVFLFVLFLLAAILPNRMSVQADFAKQTAAVPVSNGKKQTVSQTYQTDFIGGYYTSGIDFPAGTYTITALNGGGRISFKTPAGNGQSYQLGTGNSGSKELKNIHFPFGEVLFLSGVKVTLTSGDAKTGSLSQRKNSAVNEQTLSPGSYLAGTNFTEGIYDLVAVQSKGTVTAECLGISMNEAMDANGFDYQREFKNVILDSGSELTLTGVTVKLVPSK